MGRRDVCKTLDTKEAEGRSVGHHQRKKQMPQGGHTMMCKLLRPVDASRVVKQQLFTWVLFCQDVR